MVVPVRNEALVGESKVSIATDESLDLTDEVRDAGVSLVLFWSKGMISNISGTFKLKLVKFLREKKRHQTFISLMK